MGQGEGKLKEAWVAVVDLEAKYVGLAREMGYGRDAGAEDKRNSINQQGFADAIGKQEPAATITREALRDQLDEGRMNPTHMRALARLCHEFDCAWDAWLKGSASAFLERWRQHRDIRTKPGARRTDRPLQLYPARSEESYVCENLAAASLSPYQTAAGEAWPISGELSCFPSVIGGYEVAVTRCWLQVDAGRLCEVEVSDRAARQLQGTYGKVQVAWQGGQKSRPICNVEGLDGYIGRVVLPDDFCNVHGLTHGDVITLRLAVYTADLDRVVKDDDGVPKNRDAGSTADSISFRRKDYETMGKACKAAVLQVMSEKRALRSCRQLDGASEGWWIVAEAKRRVVATSRRLTNGAVGA